MTFPLSLILINYNHSKYLEKAIKQRLKQKDFFLELIIVDDGSTDKSPSIIKKYQEKNSFIKAIFHERNRGIFQAVSSGISISEGKYVHMGAVDDLLDDNFFEKSVNILDKYPKASFVFSDPGEFIEKKDIYINFPFHFSSKSRYFSPKDVKSLLRKSYFTFPSMACIFHKKKFLEVGGFREDLERNCDLFTTFLLAFKHGVCYVPEVLSWFCIRGDSYSAIGLRDKKNKRETFYKTFDILEKEYKEEYVNFREAGISYEHSFRAIYWLLISKRHRKYITFFLIKRMVSRGFWGFVRKMLPLVLRKFIRKIKGKYSVKQIKEDSYDA